MRNDLCIECHFPLPNTEHATWISKKVYSISSKLSKLGSHTLVTKVENLVTSKTENVTCKFQTCWGKRRFALSRTKQTQCDFANFFCPKWKTSLLLGLTILVPIFSATHKHVGICKNMKPKGKLHFKTSHGRRLYQKIIQAKEIYSVSNSLKD